MKHLKCVAYHMLNQEIGRRMNGKDYFSCNTIEFQLDSSIGRAAL